MNKLISTYLFRYLHPGLIMLVALLVSFHSLVRLQFEVERVVILNEGAYIQLNARVAPGLSPSVQDGVIASVAELDGILNVQMHHDAPPWPGDSELEATWNELWSTHLSPVLTVTIDSTIDPIDPLLDEIRALNHIMELEQDNVTTGQPDSPGRILLSNQTIILGVFFILFLGSAVSLILMFPIRFRRGYVVRTGTSGAGAFINPERIMLLLMGMNGLAGCLLYMLLAGLLYLLHPYIPVSVASFWFYSVIPQGTLLTLVLIGSIMAIGWWLPMYELDDVRILHSAPAE